MNCDCIYIQGRFSFPLCNLYYRRKKEEEDEKTPTQAKLPEKLFRSLGYEKLSNKDEERQSEDFIPQLPNPEELDACYIVPHTPVCNTA